MKIMDILSKPETKLFGAAFLAGLGVVAACKATLETEDILAQHIENVEKVKEEHILTEEKDDATITTINDQKAYRKDLVSVYLHTVSQIGIRYAPAALSFALSAVLLGSTYGDIKELKKENIELLAALKSTEAILKRYRDKMRADVGEEEERRFYNNIQRQDIEIMDIDEKGKEKKVKLKGAEVINGEISGDAFIFDESCGAYVGQNLDVNMNIAAMIRNQLGDNLYSNGSLMQFEILDAFGLDRDEVPGSFLRGILSIRKGGLTDTLFDQSEGINRMDIRKVWVFDEMKQEYVEKILIDPVLDGYIIDRI